VPGVDRAEVVFDPRAGGVAGTRTRAPERGVATVVGPLHLVVGRESGGLLASNSLAAHLRARLGLRAEVVRPAPDVHELAASSGLDLGGVVVDVLVDEAVVRANDHRGLARAPRGLQRGRQNHERLAGARAVL